MDEAVQEFSWKAVFKV